MRLSAVATTILFLAEQASSVQALSRILPKPVISLSQPYRHEGQIEANVRRDDRNIMNHALYHQRNVIPSPSIIAPSITALPTPIAALAAETDPWDRATEAACLNALGLKKNTILNPSGIAACYNIKYFDGSIGAFQANLRLYRVAPASGDWDSMQTQKTNVGLSCMGASIAVGTPEIRKRADRMLSWSPVRRYNMLKRSQDPPKMLQQMDFYGKINDNLIGKINDSDAVRKFLTPTITFTSEAENGNSLVANLSADGTSFVNGVLAEQTAVSPGIRPETIDGNGEFVMPGRTMGVFPTGLIITGSWTVLFLVTIGVGTVDRIRFREAYRRRKMREQNINARRI